MLLDQAHCPETPGPDRDELVTIRKARAFFPQAKELALLRRACNTWRTKKTGVALEIDLFPPKIPCRFRKICAITVVSDDWPGMGETCLGIVHERGWNVHYAQGMVLQENDQDLGVFIMAIGIESDEGLRQISAELKDIESELLSLSIGRRAKMLLIAKEAKKLALLSKVVEELAKLSSGKELQEIIAPMGESTKFFAARTDEYMHAWSPAVLAYQITTNYGLLKKVRASGGFGVIRVENCQAANETRTCITVVGLVRDISVEETLRVVGERLGFHEQYHLIEFTTQDGLNLVRLEIGQAGGRELSVAQVKELELSLKEMLSGQRVAWAHRIESRGGFEQYVRAIIPLLLKEHAATGLPQVYMSPTSREKTVASFKVIFVYSTPVGQTAPSIRLPELLQVLPGVQVVSSSSPRIMGDQRLFVMNINVDLTKFKDTEDIYHTLRKQVHEVFSEFRDFDEGMRLGDMTKLKEIEDALSGYDLRIVSRIYYAIDDFSRLSMSRDEIVRLLRLGLSALSELDARTEPDPSPVIYDERLKNHHGEVISALLAIVSPQGRGIPSCIRELSSQAQVTVSQIRHGDGELLLCRITGMGGNPPDESAIQDVLQCIAGMQCHDWH